MRESAALIAILERNLRRATEPELRERLMAALLKLGAPPMRRNPIVASERPGDRQAASFGPPAAGCCSRYAFGTRFAFRRQ
jgi:hypothetical protein